MIILNKMQAQDSQKCEEMQSQGKDMDCLGCSCSVCIAHLPNYYKKGLNKAINIIEQEIEHEAEYKKQDNIHLIEKLIQIKKTIEKEI